MEKLKELLESQGKAFEAFKDANESRLKAIEEKGYAPADLEEKVTKINEELSSLNKDYLDFVKESQRPLAGADAESPEVKERKEAMELFLRKGDSSKLSEKAITSTTDSSAGYLVIPEMDAVIDRIVPTISALAGISKNVTIGTAKWQKLVKTSGMSITWPGAGTGDGESTPPNWSKVEIEAFTAEVEPWIYNETLEDAEINLASDIAEEAGSAFAEGLGSAFVTGNGVGQPRGLTGYTAVANSSYAWGSIGYIASGGSGAFTSSAPGDKIIDLQHALKQQYRPGAVFLMSDATLSTVRQFKDASGQYYLWQPDATAGFGGRLQGAPVVIDDNMPAIAANSLSIAYGNFQKAYAVANRRGTILIRDNLTAKGKTKFNFTRRVGGGIYNFEAVKFLKFAAS